MKRTWIVAGIAAAALALLTLPPVYDRVLSFTSPDETVAEGPAAEAEADLAAAADACPADAKAANLAFTLKDQDGNDVPLSSYEGQVILLNFWATWCPPCKVEIPAFVELYSEYKDRGVVVLGVSVDDPPDKLKPFAEEYKVNYPLLVGLGQDEFQDAYGPMWGIPATIFISRDGKICKRHMGLGTRQQFEKEIQGLL